MLKLRPGCKADFWLDGEAVLYFPPDLVHQVAEMAGAKIRRRLTPDKRERLVKVGKSTRFKAKMRRYSG